MRGKWFYIWLMAMLPVVTPGARGEESYTRLDEKIVDAYNATPKKTQDVYIYAMQILEKTRQDHSDQASDWENKSRKLITIACFCEVDRALNNEELRDAYLWCKRAAANGAARGDLGGVDLKQVYEYLRNTAEQLEQAPEIKDLKYGKTMHDVLDYRTVEKSNQVRPRDRKDLSGQPVRQERNYEVTAGPIHNGDGKIYVKILYKFGARMTIRYYRGQGWKAVDPPDNTLTGYYTTWQECAAANAKIGNLTGVPQSPSENKMAEKKVYYEPVKSPEGGKP